MSLFGDWDGDGDEDLDDDIIEMLVFEDAIEAEERKQNGGSSGGGCLTSLALIILPLVVAGSLLTACGKSSTSSVENQVQERENPQIDSTEAKTEIEEAGFSYADLKTTEFWFGSGAGGWCTTLTIAEDGSFVGEYHDSEMGDYSDDYPNGSIYFCSFKGQFGDLEKVNELTYKTSIQEMIYDYDVGTEEIKDNVRYIYSEVYGLENSKTIYFYLPGTSTDTLSEGLMSWIGKDLYDYKTDTTATELPFVALYNENEEEGFSSYDIVQSAIDGIEGYEYLDQCTIELIENPDPNCLNDRVSLAQERYQTWDSCLNEIWSALLLVKSESEMDEIREAERQWISYKEQEIVQSGDDYSGAEDREFIEQNKAADLTRDRVYELAELLK